ncbi:transporter [Luteimonas gilva]|uniref:Transporter n=1 Tax=Luteimonas gilva TaxID=2572684 RepID=A0A4U5JN12_9GAMM|nr:transporter [Luteimonas gilva]TKR30156.1 transporter [Luteimonas gilva]
MLRQTTLAFAIAFALSAPVRAQDAGAGGQATAAYDVRTQLDRLESRVNEQQQEIERLRAQVQFLELGMRGRGLSDPQTATAQQTLPKELVADPQQAQNPQAPEGEQAITQIGQEQKVDDSERREQEKALVVQEHAPLFERKFTLETGASYSYYDRRQLALSGFLALDAIFLGTINLDQTKAAVLTTDVTGRYGITDRLNLEANIPYVTRTSRFVSGGAGGASTSISEVTKSSSGIGDVSVAGYYQLVKESARWPDLVASVRVRAPTGRDPFGLKLIAPDDNNNNLNVPEDLPTGSGLWSATFSVSALRTYDPVILFGNIGYTYNLPGDFDDISPVLGQTNPAKVKLGNPYQLSGGLAIALNDRAAVSFSVSTSMAGATHVKSRGSDDYERIPGSSTSTATLNIGASYLLPSGWSLNGQIANGLTPDAPNFVMSFRASRGF